MTNQLKDKRPFGVTILGVWIIVASVLMVIVPSMEVSSYLVTDPTNPRWDHDFYQNMGWFIIVSMPVGSSLYSFGAHVAIIMAFINVVTALFLLRGNPMAYYAVFVLFGIGIVSVFFHSWWIFFGSYPVFLNIIWIFILRKDEAKMFFGMQA